VYRLDRLARDLILQETLLREIAAQGGRVFSTFASEQEVIEDDPDDPSRRLIRQVLGAVSEYERSLIRLRLHNGRRRKHERGGYAFGSPGYGWRAEAKELVPEPSEQAALARIRQLRATGQSVRAIAAVLTDEGHQPKRGGQWHPETVRRICARIAVPEQDRTHVAGQHPAKGQHRCHTGRGQQRPGPVRPHREGAREARGSGLPPATLAPRSGPGSAS
jgi:Resolvase, N terminal domain/Recombinase